MTFSALTDESQLDTLLQDSFQSPQWLFKHSPRCGTSAYIHERLSLDEGLKSHRAYLIDVVQYRPLARLIATRLEVYHHSPQVLLIHQGACLWDEDHLSIQPEEMLREFQHCLANAG